MHDPVTKYVNPFHRDTVAEYKEVSPAPATAKVPISIAAILENRDP